MSGKLLIPLCFFIVCNTIYDSFGTVQNTNWSIFYFTSQYFAWLLLIFLLPKPVPFLKRLPFYILGIGLGIYILIELSNLGKNYEAYYLNVNSFKSVILPVSAIISGLTFYSLKTCRQ
jgi:hypothetical protein